MSSIGLPSQVRLWILRILVELEAWDEFISVNGFSSQNLARRLGLDTGSFRTADGYDVSRVKETLRKQLDAAHFQEIGPKTSRLTKNLDNVSPMIGLRRADRVLLEFLVCMDCVGVLSVAVEWLGIMNTNQAFHKLARVLSLSTDEVRGTVDEESPLIRLTLLVFKRYEQGTLRNKFALSDDTMAERLANEDVNPMTLFQGKVHSCESSDLTLANYEHIRTALDMLRPYLKQVITTRRVGVNILLHGTPGTGKSQLSRVLAADCGVPLHEVTTLDVYGTPITGVKRLQALNMAQVGLGGSHALLLFEEAEDIFDDGSALDGSKSTAQTRKAWVNRLLERNETPTIWITNSVTNIDAAFIRRFDMVVELPALPQSQRHRLLHDAFADILTIQDIDSLSQLSTLSPAMVKKAASVIHEIKEQLTVDAAASGLKTMIRASVDAQGGSTRHSNAYSQQDSKLYDLEWINSDVNLAEVVEGLIRCQTGRLCLYGPPGTGKTAFGQHLARALDKPLLVRRASDILSAWKGETEQNIRRVFSEANREGAVLLLDEVDSFLQERQQAQRSWEITEVNEMLTQMENFSGIFVATTNHLSTLDSAVFRRFDLKIHFDYLRDEQTESLFEAYCDRLQLRKSNHVVRDFFAVTPGDFAAIERRHRIQQLKSTEELAMLLQNECRSKTGARARVGFL